MVVHFCPKCNKKFTRSDVLKKHMNRKYPCIPETQNTIIEKKLESMENEIKELKHLIKELSQIILSDKSCEP